MGPCLIWPAGLFATLDAVAVDQPRWRMRGCIADEATSTASSRHFNELFMGFGLTILDSLVFKSGLRVAPQSSHISSFWLIIAHTT